MRADGQSSPSPSHLPTDSIYVVSVLIIAELARGRRWNGNLEPNFCPGRGLNPEPHDWQSSTLTTRLPAHIYLYHALIILFYLRYSNRLYCNTICRNIDGCWVLLASPTYCDFN